MRAAWALLLVGCGFPDVKPGDASLTDGTLAESGAEGGTEGGADGGMEAAVVTGCTTSMDCAKTCTGKLSMGNCGCQAYLADSAPPNCDSSCQATGCLNKSAVCVDGGICIIQ